MKYLFILAVVSACSAQSLFAQDLDTQRSDRDLIALYDFADARGETVKDRSQFGEPLNLKIGHPDRVQRTSGSLTIQKGTLIRSERAAKKIIDAVRDSGEITIEAWVHPANMTQAGPARIATLSSDIVNRFFTLGQERDEYQVRFRTNKTSRNGLPATSSPKQSDIKKLVHVVYVRRSNGDTSIYLNGKKSTEGRSPGQLSPWTDSFHFCLANEVTNDRPWLGTFHLVAIYSRALIAKEINAHHALGIANIPPAKIANAPVKQPPAKQPMAATSTGGQRVSKSLQVFYDFNESAGSVVFDRSGVGKPINLKIQNAGAVRRRSGSLEVTAATVIQSDSGVPRLSESVKRSGAITIEAWVHPANTMQAGPARIVTLSKDGNSRNFTLGQEANKYIARFRTSGTSTNGIPSTDTDPKSVRTSLTHIVYTRARSGTARIYLNGKQVVSKTTPGNLQNWDSNYRLALANEFSADRQWRGKYHLVAVYNRDLSSREIQQNYRAGASGTNGPQKIIVAKSANTQLFESMIAPLLSKHCLECHDSATHQGGLNLARKGPALGESDSGKSIVPKNATKSLVWQSVKDDEMPHDRPPLSADEKQLLKQWIDGGAEWSFAMIDPAIYTHEGRTNQNWLQRLTVSEYIETVRATFGVDIAAEAKQILPPDMRADGFNNTAYNLNVDLQHVEAYTQLARMVVSRMDTRKFAKRFRSKLSLTDKDMCGLITEMGKWVLRGPLEDHEVVLYRGVSTTVASAGGDLDDAIGFVIQAMLQSPRFLYRIENQRGDGDAWEISEYELATRMSYIIWGASPDKELFDAASRGDLYDNATLERHVQRMLKDPRAIKRSTEFVSQWLNLNRLDNMAPNAKRFPKWDPKLAKDMRSETLAFAEEVLWKQKRPMADLLSAQVTFLTPALARHYGLQQKNGDGIQRYDLSNVPSRGGLMTHGSVLTVGGDDASMVTRGLLVMHELLRGVVKDPPACVDTTPVPSQPGTSQRMIAEARIKNESCGGCHSKFEPLAFGLEKFDGVGGYHEKDEHGNRLREDGEMLIPGQSKPAAYKTSADLMKMLANSQRVQESLTWKVTQFALGRPLLAADAPMVDQIHKRAQKNGGTYQALISAVVASDLVQKTRTESE